MPAQRKTIRRMTTVRGFIDPRLVYDADGLMRAAGIGKQTLAELRHTGRLKAMKFCGQGRNWYRGRDIVRLMEKCE